MPPSAELRKRPQDGISWVQKVAAVENCFRGCFWRFGNICEYIGGRSRSGGHRGAHKVGARPPPLWPPRGFLDGGSKSLGSYLMRKSRFRRFHSVWIPFDNPFLRNTEIGKKTAICTGPWVSRLVPKII